jgi:hypothetical protein
VEGSKDGILKSAPCGKFVNPVLFTINPYNIFLFFYNFLILRTLFDKILKSAPCGKFVNPVLFTINPYNIFLFFYNFLILRTLFDKILKKPMGGFDTQIPPLNTSLSIA